MRLSRLLVRVVLLAVAALALPHRAAFAEEEAGKDVVVATSDGMKLAATWWGAPQAKSAGVVLLHMYRSDRSAWTPLVPALRARGLQVLAIDLRGHGGSVKQSKGGDLAKRVEKRDPKLFADMIQDAFAGMKFLAQQGKCDPKRIALVGASVGCSVALDSARRIPDSVAAVVCLSPGAKYLELDSVEHAKALRADLPVLLLVHRGELEVGAKPICDVRPQTELLVYDGDPPDEDAKGLGDLWAHGTRMFGRIPLVEQTVASYVALHTKSAADTVVLDGVVADEGADGGAWTKTTKIADGPGITAWAYRVGRRVQFGGRTRGATKCVFVGVATVFPEGTAPGYSSDEEQEFPEIGAIDLERSAFAWVAPFDSARRAKNPRRGDRVRPVVRSVRTDDGWTFEGEWISDYGERRSGGGVEFVPPDRLRLALEARDTVTEPPREIAPGAVPVEVGWLDGAVVVPTR